MPKKILIIGAVALGPKAACRVKRLDPTAQVTMIDKGDIVSYGGCGIPYFISGDVSDIKELRTTSFKTVRDESFFRQAKDVTVLTNTLALAIDRKAKLVRVRDLASGQEQDLAYDNLVLATGATPRRLGLPGQDLPGVFSVADLHDAEAIREIISQGRVSRAVVVGSGFIGLEVAEALRDMWGLEVAVVEVMDQVLPANLSPVLARMAEEHLRENGLELHFSEKVLGFEGQDRVERVVTDKRVIEAEMVVVAAGVVPNTALAGQAGLALSARGGVLVDEHMRSSDPDIFAGGDCVEVANLITGQPFFLPLGSMANRQGRVIGSNLAGGSAKFPGAVGSFAVKTFERTMAGAGLTPAQAAKAGFNALSTLVIQLDRAHFFPGKELMTLELTVDRDTRRILGIQGLGPMGDALVGRIGAVAGIMSRGATVGDLSNLEYPYSPPFSQAMDIVNTLGNVADNMLMGMNQGISPGEFEKLFAGDQNQTCFFLDCREPDNASPFLTRHPGVWHNIPQGSLRERLAEVPRDKTVVLVCNTGSRSYEAQVTLNQAGIKDVLNLHGGMAALKQTGIKL